MPIELRRALRPDPPLRARWDIAEAAHNCAQIADDDRLTVPAIGECVQQLGRHDNEEVVMT
ncbi:MAG TPA: hypothetical protein VK988_03730 [Acidimicrobiales bacterium]|nr:hypothetical protein [Acidimicrobiales bacterium]